MLFHCFYQLQKIGRNSANFCHKNTNYISNERCYPLSLPWSSCLMIVICSVRFCNTPYHFWASFATVLYDYSRTREPIEKWMKAAGAHWDCYYALNFYGWEDQRVVIVTPGGSGLMERITRAKTKLFIVLVDPGYGYSETKGYFQQAAKEGLVEMKWWFLWKIVTF